MDDDNEERTVIEDDFYTFLNVSRNATADEINNAYRRMSRLYHPDKHLEPLKKKEAEILFNKTKKAYEVLSDPHQRAIYDSLGTRGLETEGWEIVQRTKTPQEIREEYERLAREREERRLQQRTNPKGNVTVNINATDIFNKYQDEYDEIEQSGFPTIEVSGMSFSQSIEAPLTLQDTVTMAGSLSTQNGVGSGSVNVSARRLISEKGWVEAEFGAGSGPMLSLKGFRTLTKRTFANATGLFQFTPVGIRPGLVTTIATQLDSHTVGYLTWRAGIHSSMATVLVRDTPTSHTSLTLQFGIPHSYVSLGYCHKMDDQELKLRTSLKAGTFGAILEYGAEKKVSQHTSIAASVVVGIPTGVTLKIKYVTIKGHLCLRLPGSSIVLTLSPNSQYPDSYLLVLSRANQTYNFPIHLCEEVLPSPVFYATVTPVIVWAVLKRLVIDPMVREQKERDKEKQREVNKSRITEKRREAKAAVNLMRATFARIRSDEEAKKGLVIVKALYGRLSATEGGGEGDGEEETEVIEVMIPLQCLVKDSKLVLHEASKVRMPGSIPGEVKHVY
uniref:J domain-containing protein n=1 Tax=Timema cristinae TaxID=61476 RepID=A0A7R9H6M6_TIMCR|nr:unnamed protein product [Timema cristinae]